MNQTEQINFLFRRFGCFDKYYWFLELVISSAINLVRAPLRYLVAGESWIITSSTYMSKPIQAIISVSLVVIWLQHKTYLKRNFMVWSIFCGKILIRIVSEKMFSGRSWLLFIDLNVQIHGPSFIAKIPNSELNLAPIIRKLKCMKKII